MRNTTNILLLFALCLPIQFYFPWYNIVVVAGLMGACREDTAIKAFLNGFISIALLWLSMAIYTHSQATGNLAMQISQMTKLPVWCLFLLTTVIGGITGGLSCSTGCVLKKSFQKDNN